MQQDAIRSHTAAGPEMKALSDISQGRRRTLASGRVETRDWTEWMATDMSRLARVVAKSLDGGGARLALAAAAEEAHGRGILERLAIFGRKVGEFRGSSDFQLIARHPSDVVRQWAAYAVNDLAHEAPLAVRLEMTLPFAADPHMSVRECAWMAFRPHFARSVAEGLRLLEPISLRPDANERRFAIEVSRPRSVWGKHIELLKREPHFATKLLTNVHQDASRYVRLAVGNWLNDASKSKPEWVREICACWLESANKHTRAIVSRGLRTLSKERESSASTGPLEKRVVHRAKNAQGLLRRPSC